MYKPQDKLICDYPFTCHSQPETAQDEWVIRKLCGKERGFFIEIGAYDGVYHSNTLTLERQLEWTGILIEADQFAVTKALKVRWARVLNYIVAPDCGSRYMRPDLRAGHIIYNNPIIRQATVSLQAALAAEYIPSVVDYLSIDVEGDEYQILESYFKSPYARKFRCMTVEVGKNQDDLGRLITLLHPLGYRLDRIQAWEAYFINPELL